MADATRDKGHTTNLNNANAATNEEAELGNASGDSTPPAVSEKASSRPSFSSRFKKHMTAEITPRWADLVLISMFFVSGMIDSAAFNVWSCFVSMQTGNTIFVGLGVSSQPLNSSPFSWTKSLVAIICFLCGAFFFSNFHRFFGPLRRWVIFASFALQAIIIVVAAVLATTGVVTNRVDSDRQKVSSSTFSSAISYAITIRAINWTDIAPLAILAFQSSGQIVASRMLKYNELPTIVLTSLYADLMSDARLLTAGLREDAVRNRRAVAAVVLFSGAVSGGFLTKSWAGLAGALWIAAFLKCAAAVAWLIWVPAKKKT